MTNAIIKADRTDRISVVDRMLSNKKPATRRKYRQDLQTFADFLQVDLRALTRDQWKQFDPALLSAYRETLETSVSPKTGRLLAPSTVAGKLTAVRELLTEASFFGLIDPADLEYIRKRVLKMSTDEMSKIHHPNISREDIDKLLATAAKQKPLKNLRDYALFRLWLDTGVRRAELAALRVKDLVVEEGTAKIIVRQGKGGKSRKIPITNETAEYITTWLTAAELTDPDHVLFCQLRRTGRGAAAHYTVPELDHSTTGRDPRYKPLSGVALDNLVRWYRKTAGIKSKFTCHSFRVNLVTTMLTDIPKNRTNSKDAIGWVTAVGGWKNSRMPLDIYNRTKYDDKAIGDMRQDPLPALAELAA